MNDLKKNTHISFHRSILLFLFFLIAVSASSQTDTLTDSDSETAPKEKINYFLNKFDYPVPKDTLQLRQLPSSVVKKMHDDDDFWYANADIKTQTAKETKTDTGTPMVQQGWFQVLLWLIIIGGFASFIVIYLDNSNVRLFSRRNRNIIEVEEENIETDDIFVINYQKEVEKAVANKNFRYAIRLLFLRMLRDLSKKNIIQYKQERTNFDYLLQLSPTDHYKDFFRLARNYEYSWYGHFDVNEESYRSIQDDFSRFEKKLNHI